MDDCFSLLNFHILQEIHVELLVCQSQKLFIKMKIDFILEASHVDCGLNYCELWELPSYDNSTDRDTECETSLLVFTNFLGGYAEEYCFIGEN